MATRITKLELQRRPWRLTSKSRLESDWREVARRGPQKTRHNAFPGQELGPANCPGSSRSVYYWLDTSRCRRRLRTNIANSAFQDVRRLSFGMERTPAQPFENAPLIHAHSLRSCAAKGKRKIQMAPINELNRTWCSGAEPPAYGNVQTWNAHSGQLTVRLREAQSFAAANSGAKPIHSRRFDVWLFRIDSPPALPNDAQPSRNRNGKINPDHPADFASHQNGKNDGQRVKSQLRSHDAR